jgi:hypothetical protein
MIGNEDGIPSKSSDASTRKPKASTSWSVHRWARAAWSCSRFRRRRAALTSDSAFATFCDAEATSFIATRGQQGRKANCAEWPASCGVIGFLSEESHLIRVPCFESQESLG